MHSKAVSLTFTPINPGNRQAVNSYLIQRWYTHQMVVRGRVYNMCTLPGIVAWQGGHIAGVVTYTAHRGVVYVISLNATVPGQGVGTALLNQLVLLGQTAGNRVIQLITTNDNLAALRFYQRRGFCLVRVYPGAISASRAIKPQIPLVGEYGIPLRDEILLQLQLIPKERK